MEKKMTVIRLLWMRSHCENCGLHWMKVLQDEN